MIFIRSRAREFPVGFACSWRGGGTDPAWLDLAQPEIRVVDHRTMLAAPDAGLPTCNAAAIDSRLHRVPDHAGHCVLFSDDVTLGRPVQPGESSGPHGDPGPVALMAGFLDRCFAQPPYERRDGGRRSAA